jgi:hypothetical protein
MVLMKVKIKKENCLITKYVYLNNKEYKGPRIGVELVRHGPSGYALSAIILAWIPV